MRKTLWILWLAAGLSALPGGARGAGRKLPLDEVRLPPGFRIEAFADDVPGARSLALGPAGIVFVGTRQAGKVYALTYKEGAVTADKVVVVASGLDMPNGVAFREGSLYVAESGRVSRFDGIAARLNDPPKPVVLTEGLPKERAHGWKFIAFGPDGKLYIPVGAPCNVCEPGDPYASIVRMDALGGALEMFARGVRNTVGFDWQPGTRELWFTDNGRDLLGDDRPPDELNHAPRAEMHFGFPYRHGKDVVDPEFGAKAGGRKFTPPAQELGAHVAALGMRFYTGAMFPAAYRNGVFIAEHGSWNWKEPAGYRVTTVVVEGGKASGYRVFAEGWLKDGKAWGRPVDVLVMPDGALLVSDDKAGAVYRVSYAPPNGVKSPDDAGGKVQVR